MWLKLTPPEAEDLYGVVSAAAGDPAPDLYAWGGARRSSSGDDGPWSLISIAVSDGYATLRIANVEEEQLSWDGFDPLEEPLGFLLLHRPEVEAMAALLADTAGRLPEPVDDRPRLVTLDAGEVAARNLEDEVFEGHRQSFHLAPAPDDDEGFPGAVVIFSSIDPQPASLLFIGLRELAAARGGAVPAAGEGSLARVRLDGAGLGELAALLSDEAEHLAAP